MKLCANLSFMFNESDDLLERYSLASAAGFKAVECAFPYTTPKEEIKNILNKTGLKQILLNTEPGDVLGFAGRPGEQQKFMDSLKLSLEYCKHLDVKLLHIMSGKQKEGTTKDQVKETIKENLKMAIPLLQKQGVIGLLEPINKFSVPDYNMNSFELAVDIIRELDHPNIRLQLDLFHLQQLEGNVSRRVKELLPLVEHIQIAQVPGRGEPDSGGELNYQYIFALLNQLGYQGWIGLEYKPATTTIEGLKWVKDYGLEL